MHALDAIDRDAAEAGHLRACIGGRDGHDWTGIFKRDAFAEPDRGPAADTDDTIRLHFRRELAAALCELNRYLRNCFGNDPAAASAEEFDHPLRQSPAPWCRDHDSPFGAVGFHRLNDAR